MWSSGIRQKKLKRLLRSEVGELARLLRKPSNAAPGMQSWLRRAQLENADSLLLVLSGDVPMIRAETLQSFVDHHRSAGPLVRF